MAEGNDKKSKKYFSGYVNTKDSKSLDDFFGRNGKLDDEQIERKQAVTHGFFEGASRYPFAIASFGFGDKIVNAGTKDEDAVHIHPTDNGIQFVSVQEEWIEKLTIEYQVAGLSPRKARLQAEQCAFVSIVQEIQRLINSLAKACNEEDSPIFKEMDGKHPIEILQVMLLEEISEARHDKSFPKALLNLWLAPIILAMMDCDDKEELLEKLKAKQFSGDEDDDED